MGRGAAGSFWRRSSAFKPALSCAARFESSFLGHVGKLQADERRYGRAEQDERSIFATGASGAGIRQLFPGARCGTDTGPCSGGWRRSGSRQWGRTGSGGSAELPLLAETFWARSGGAGQLDPAEWSTVHNRRRRPAGLRRRIGGKPERYLDTGRVDEDVIPADGPRTRSTLVYGYRPTQSGSQSQARAGGVAGDSSSTCQRRPPLAWIQAGSRCG